DSVDIFVPGVWHGPQPFGDERNDLELASTARHADAVAALDGLLVGQLLRYFDESLGLQSDQQRHVLSDVVLMLGEAVARRDVWEVRDLAEPVRAARSLVVEERHRIL